MDPETLGAPDVNSDATGGQQTTEPQGNPAWQELYGVLPDSLHSVVKPVLEKWETGTNTKFQEYAETQKAFEPYKPFIDNQIPAEQIEQALAVAQLIDSNPKQFMEQMQAFFGEQEPQIQQQQQQPNNEPPGGETFGEEPFDLESNPYIQQMRQQQDTIANYLAMQAQQQQQQEADAQLAQELDALKQKHGEYDERYVITLAASGMPLEDAVKQYHQFVDSVRNQPRADANVPNILSPSGGVPSEQVNPADMTPEQRKAFVIAALAQANGQG